MGAVANMAPDLFLGIIAAIRATAVPEEAFAQTAGKDYVPVQPAQPRVEAVRRNGGNGGRSVEAQPANDPRDMNLPGWRLHALKGELKGHWAVSVDGNWRLIFQFEGEDAVLVDYQDYH